MSETPFRPDLAVSLLQATFRSSWCLAIAALQASGCVRCCPPGTHVMGAGRDVSGTACRVRSSSSPGVPWGTRLPRGRGSILQSSDLGCHCCGEFLTACLAVRCQQVEESPEVTQRDQSPPLLSMINTPESCGCLAGSCPPPFTALWEGTISIKLSQWWVWEVWM